MILPADDFILLSVINTKLRDNYGSLESLCEEEDIDMAELCRRLARAGYTYDEAQNAFK